MFAPIVATRGKDGLTKVHTLSEFVSEFGAMDSTFYDLNGQMAYNIYNWLSNGGTLLVYKLTGTKASNIEQTENNTAYAAAGIFTAVYSGTYYNNLTVEIIGSGAGDSRIFNITIIEDNRTIEEFRNVKFADLKKTLENSEYIRLGSGKEDAFSSAALRTKTENNVTTIIGSSIPLSGGTNAASSLSTTCTKLVAFWNSTDAVDKASIIKNHLEYPIDIIFDAGYPFTLKSAMMAFIGNNDGVGTAGALTAGATRPDIIGIFDAYDLVTSTTPSMAIGITGDTAANISKINSTNIAVYEQYFTIDDNVFANNSTRIVGPSYFLTKLIAFNDQVYGPQLPLAGLRRAILDDATSINENPDETKKEEWFSKRFNYVEKTSREYAFMSQRTADGSTETKYTALSFLNNSRCLAKMSREVEMMARQYLHEYNDAVTISNMSRALNNYIAGWVANRTLTLGFVDVSESDLSENELIVTLNVKFNNTIEVISVNIIID